jgi:hypothetical protein
MSVDSFVTAVSDVTNLNSDVFITGTKGRFKVVHIEDTDEGIKLYFKKCSTICNFSVIDC